MNYLHFIEILIQRFELQMWAATWISTNHSRSSSAVLYCKLLIFMKYCKTRRSDWRICTLLQLVRPFCTLLRLQNMLLLVPLPARLDSLILIARVVKVQFSINTWALCFMLVVNACFVVLLSYQGTLSLVAAIVPSISRLRSLQTPFGRPGPASKGCVCQQSSTSCAHLAHIAAVRLMPTYN